MEMPRASAAGRVVSLIAASDDADQVEVADVEPQLAGDDATHVEQNRDELLLRARVAINDVDPSLHQVGVVDAAFQDPRPALDRVERVS